MYYRHTKRKTENKYYLYLGIFCWQVFVIRLNLIKDCLLHLIDDFRNKSFNKISLDNMLKFHN